MTLEQASWARFVSRSSQDETQAGTGYGVSVEDRPAPLRAVTRCVEVVEADETFGHVTTGATALALADLLGAIEQYLERNLPGVSLADLRRLTATASVPSGVMRPVASGE